MCIKAVTTALEGLDGVQSVSVKKGAASTITMKAGKMLTKEKVQKALGDAKKNSPYKVTAFAQAKAKEAKKDQSPTPKKKTDNRKTSK